MNDWHNKRDEDYRILFVNLYTLCIIVFSTAVLLKFTWEYKAFPPEDVFLIYSQFGPIVIFLLAALLGCFLIIRFNAILQGVLILVLFVFIFIIVYHDIYLKTLLIIPVAFAAFFKNKTFGSMVALGCGLLLIFLDMYLYGSDFNIYLESDIIFTGVMIISAWLTGGISEIEQRTRKVLQDMANRDGLSRVYNHRYFQVYLKNCLEEAKQKNGSLSLIIFDIDYFKYYNDTFGHIAGDHILKDVGKILLEHVPSNAIAARYGGDEFCILLPEDSSKAYSLAKELKYKIESLAPNNTNLLPTGKLTITIGLANYPEHSKTGEDLLDLADQALYKAKKRNKDKIELYFNVLDSLKSACTKSETEMLSSMRTLLSIINAKDRYTYGHSERVLEYATLLAGNYGLPEDEIKYVQYGAYLHDIGKIEIDINILNAPGKLSESEWDILKQHPYWGSEIIRSIDSLTKVAPYILHHHENFDGSGYPLGIRGKDIPLGARIIRIADSFDAITTDRPYKKGISYENACNELIKFSGSHYDPELCNLFVKVIQNKKETLDSLKD